MDGKVHSFMFSFADFLESQLKCRLQYCLSAEKVTAHSSYLVGLVLLQKLGF